MAYYGTRMDVKPINIRYKGLFDYDTLYNEIVEWFKSNKYWFQENDFKHKVPSPYGAEQEIRMSGDKKVSEYLEYKATLDWHIWDMTEVEVVKDGKKKTLTSARIEIRIVGTMKLDYEDRMRRHPIWSALTDVYHRYFE